MSANHDSRLSGAVIGAAIAVHRELGPGLDEPIYEQALCEALNQEGLAHRTQVGVPLHYKGVRLDCGYRLDVLVESRLVIDVKVVEAIAPVHEAHLLTYLRLSKHELGLLLNFEVPVLRDGIRRRILSDSHVETLRLSCLCGAVRPRFNAEARETQRGRWPQPKQFGRRPVSP